MFVVGDSIVEGTGAIPASGAWTHIAATALGVPQLEMSKGGTSQNTLQTTYTGWTPYLAYARILVDEMGTNNGNAVLDFFSYWAEAREVYNYDKVIKVGLFPNVVGYDDFQTEAAQVIVREYPSAFPDLHLIELLKYGNIDYGLNPVSVRGVTQGKWIVNGTPFYSSSDGVHQSVGGNALLAAEFQTFLAAVTVTS
jgi:lysophospholipase L1-like esterase